MYVYGLCACVCAMHVPMYVYNAICVFEHMYSMYEVVLYMLRLYMAIMTHLVTPLYCTCMDVIGELKMKGEVSMTEKSFMGPSMLSTSPEVACMA